MKAYRKHLESKDYSQSTTERQIKHIKSFLVWIESKGYELQKLSYTHLLKYIELQRNKGITESTLVHYLGYLSTYFDYLIEQQQIEQNPLANVRLRNQTQQRKESELVLHELLSEEELDILYQIYTANKRLNKKNRILLSLLIYQGIAAAETRYIKVKDIDLEKGTLHLLQSRKYQERQLDLVALQILPISEYIENKSKDELLFTYKNDSQASNSRLWLRQQLQIELRRSKNYQIHFKNLPQIRNSKICLWVSQYGLRKAQYLAGHKNISTTQRFKKTDILSLQQSVQEFHPLK